MGSCTANSVVSACELILAANQKSRHLSRLFNYYTTRQLENRLGQEGAVLRNAVRQATKLGIPNEDVWDYSFFHVEAAPPVAVYVEADLHKISRYERIVGETAKDKIHAIKSALSEGFPVVFGMPVSQQWMQMQGGDTSYRGTKNDAVVGNHAMCIIGYSSSHFIVENSWGVEWGDKGLGYVPCELVDEFFEAWVIKGFDGLYPVAFIPPAPTPPVVPPTPLPEPSKPSVKPSDNGIVVVAITFIAFTIYALLKSKGII